VWADDEHVVDLARVDTDDGHGLLSEQASLVGLHRTLLGKGVRSSAH
jgi:hypothetical protein